MRRYFRAVVALLFVIVSVTAVNHTVHAEDCLSANADGCMFGLPTFQYQTLLTQMIANPTPNVRQLDVDNKELGITTYYRAIGGSIPVFDAPNGKIVGLLQSGYGPVNFDNAADGWAHIGYKRYVKTSDLTNASASNYAGVLIDTPLAYPLAWVLAPTYTSSIPGQKPDADAPMLERYQRVNIFDSVNINNWNWYLVGPGQWIEERRVAKMTPVARPDGVKGRWVSVDLYDQVLIAYDGDTPIFTTLVSTGMPRDGFGTNKGLFNIWARYKATRMTGGMGGPDAYDLADVPWVMYFDESISLHGTYWHDGFGFRHSHGCVNLSITDSHWLFNWTDNFYADTFVYVYSSRDYVKYMPYTA